MYNEDEVELKNTLRGLIHNYNCFRADKKFNFTKDDFLIFIVCDGYDNIPKGFRDFARDKGFLDEEKLVTKGFMSFDTQKRVYKMRPLSEVCDPGTDPKEIPSNLLHVF
jgi:cellulose synthase/poly-beta-1,6-N-acetylglucosamine synthase-like glycosyltransferase